MRGVFFENEYKVTPYLWVHPQNKQELKDYWLPIDMAKEIAKESKYNLEGGMIRCSGSVTT